MDHKSSCEQTPGDRALAPIHSCRALACSSGHCSKGQTALGIVEDWKFGIAHCVSPQVFYGGQACDGLRHGSGALRQCSCYPTRNGFLTVPYSLRYKRTFAKGLETRAEIGGVRTLP